MFDMEPEVIKRELEFITQTIVEVLGEDQVSSIYLIGSAARNELSIYSNGSDIDIYSDYEFAVITKISSRLPLQELNDLIKKRHVTPFGRTTLFKVDLGIFPQIKLGFIPASLWSFEFVDCAVLMFGKEVRHLVRPITHQNIDKGNLRWLIAVRLWNYLKHEELDIAKSSTLNKLLLARNLLEIPSIALPHFGILKSGYRKRNQELINLPSDLIEALGGKTLFDSALRVKLNPENGLNLRTLTVFSLYNSFMALSAKLAKHKVNVSPGKLVVVINKLSRAGFFRMKPFKELRMLSNNFRYCKHIRQQSSLYRSIRWFFSPTRYYFFGLLISIYEMRFAKCKKDSDEWGDSVSKWYEATTGKRLVFPSCLNDVERHAYIIAEIKKFMKIWYEGNR